ncbi:MAG: hypothetical protein OSJ62_04020 [Lachnospiraceae bacterium]|nr:hypothetical protein [Lachnospiraceae bacterium]
MGKTTNKTTNKTKNGAVCIYRKSNYQLYAQVCNEVSGMRVGIKIYLFLPKKNTYSHPYRLERREVIMGKNSFDFLFNYECYFTREDVLKIQEIVKEMVSKKTKNMEIEQSKATIEEIYFAIQEYIIEHQKKLEEDPEAQVYQKNGYGYLSATQFKEFLNAYEELGCKRKEILDCLKQRGVLEAGTGRAYDIQVSKNGKKLRFFKIRMEENVLKEKKEVVA